MTSEQIAAIKAVLGTLVQFEFGPIGPATPYRGLVALTPEQYRALSDLVKPQGQ